MFAARIAGLALAAYLAANSSAFADGTWQLYITSKWDSPTQPDALSDVPKPSPSPNLASPQAGGQASSHSGWGKWEVQLGTVLRGTRVNAKADGIKSTSIPKLK